MCMHCVTQSYQLKMSYQGSNFFNIEFLWFSFFFFFLYIVYILRGRPVSNALFVFLTVLLIGSEHLSCGLVDFRVF